MKIPEEKIEEIKNALRIEDVVGEYTHLTIKSGRFWGLCPFHQEKTPSFSVTPEEKLFYCFGCHKGGSLFTFIQEIENCSFQESVEILAKKANIALSYKEDIGSSVRKKKAELYTRVAKSFHHILLHFDEAQNAVKYLENRGISGEMIERFNLGWAPRSRSWLWSFLRTKSYSESFLKESGLFSKKGNRTALFSGRIMFPIYSTRGDVIGFGGRALDDRQPKYINSQESDIFKKRDNLYGANLAMQEIRKNKSFVLVEGYLDVIALHQAGIQHTVAPLGTALTESQASLLRRYTENGIIMFDGDAAGAEATKKALLVLENTGIDCSVAEMDSEEDPADVWLKEGSEALNKRLKYSINAFDFITKQVKLKYDTDTPHGTERAVRETFGYIDAVRSEVKKEGYLKSLSEELGLEIEAVWRDFKLEKSRKRFGTEEEGRVLEGKKLSTELYLMIAVVINHDYFSLIRNSLSPGDFTDPRAKEIFVVLEEGFRADRMDTEQILEKLEDENIKNRILSAIATKEFETDTERIIEECIREIKIKSIEQKRKKIGLMIRDVEKKNEDTETLSELLEEKMYLDNQLEELKVGFNAKSTN